MDLLKDQIKKIYFKFLIPALGSAMVVSIYTLTDAIVIGQGIGSDAIAALSLTTPLLCILMSTGILFGVGGTVHMNICRGMGDKQKALEYFTLSFIGIGAITLLLWLIYGLHMKALLTFMGASDVLYPYAADYMKWFNVFLPVAVFSNYIAIFVRNDHAPNLAMASVICGGIVNIILDIVLVFPLGLGMAGAALASTLGMCIQVAVAGSHFFSKKSTLRFIKPHHFLAGIRDILNSGISSFLNEFANGFIVYLFNIQILKYGGTDALSIYGVISYCVILFNSLFTGVGQALSPIVSTNYGGKKIGRIKEACRYSYLTILLMGAIFSALGILLPTQVSSVFVSLTPSLESICNLALPMYFIAFLPMGFNVLTSYYLQGILRTKASFVISILRNVVLSGALILLLPQVMSANILWAVMPTVEWSCAFANLFVMKKASLSKGSHKKSE